MGLLHVSLFGSVSVYYDDAHDQIKLTPAIQELLAYLVVANRYPHSRDVLAEMFWGGYSQEKARGCLKTALWRLRRAIEPEGIPSGTYILSTQQGEIAFNHDSPHWIDVHAFLQQVTPVLNHSATEINDADADACSAALELYTGDFLEGIYNDWAILQRERLRIIYLEALTCMLNYYKEQHQFDKSLDYARRILEIDPLREEIHREMMRLYIQSGQRPQALQQFEACQAVLQRELGIAPMEETQQLYHLIIGEEGIGIPASSSRPEENELLVSVLGKIQDARKTLNQAQEQFLKAAQILEGILLRDK